MKFVVHIKSVKITHITRYWAWVSKICREKDLNILVRVDGQRFLDTKVPKDTLLWHIHKIWVRFKVTII